MLKKYLKYKGKYLNLINNRGGSISEYPSFKRYKIILLLFPSDGKFALCMEKNSVKTINWKIEKILDLVKEIEDNDCHYIIIVSLILLPILVVRLVCSLSDCEKINAVFVLNKEKFSSDCKNLAHNSSFSFEFYYMRCLARVGNTYVLDDNKESLNIKSITNSFTVKKLENNDVLVAEFNSETSSGDNKVLSFPGLEDISYTKFNTPSNTISNFVLNALYYILNYSIIQYIIEKKLFPLLKKELLVSDNELYTISLQSESQQKTDAYKKFLLLCLLNSKKSPYPSLLNLRSNEYKTQYLEGLQKKLEILVNPDELLYIDTFLNELFSKTETSKFYIESKEHISGSQSVDKLSIDKNKAFIVIIIKFDNMYFILSVSYDIIINKYIITVLKIVNEYMTIEHQVVFDGKLNDESFNTKCIELIKQLIPDSPELYSVICVSFDTRTIDDKTLDLDSIGDDKPIKRSKNKYLGSLELPDNANHVEEQRDYYKKKYKEMEWNNPVQMFVTPNITDFNDIYKLYKLKSDLEDKLEHSQSLLTFTRNTITELESSMVVLKSKDAEYKKSLSLRSFVPESSYSKLEGDSIVPTSEYLQSLQPTKKVEEPVDSYKPRESSSHDRSSASSHSTGSYPKLPNVDQTNISILESGIEKLRNGKYSELTELEEQALINKVTTSSGELNTELLQLVKPLLLESQSGSGMVVENVPQSTFLLCIFSKKDLIKYKSYYTRMIKEYPEKILRGVILSENEVNSNFYNLLFKMLYSENSTNIIICLSLEFIEDFYYNVCCNLPNDSLYFYSNVSVFIYNFEEFKSKYNQKTSSNVLSNTNLEIYRLIRLIFNRTYLYAENTKSTVHLQTTFTLLDNKLVLISQDYVPDPKQYVSSSRSYENEFDKHFIGRYLAVYPGTKGAYQDFLPSCLYSSLLFMLTNGYLGLLIKTNFFKILKEFKYTLDELISPSQLFEDIQTSSIGKHLSNIIKEYSTNKISRELFIEKINNYTMLCLISILYYIVCENILLTLVIGFNYIINVLIIMYIFYHFLKNPLDFQFIITNFISTDNFCFKSYESIIDFLFSNEILPTHSSLVKSFLENLFKPLKIQLFIENDESEEFNDGQIEIAATVNISVKGGVDHATCLSLCPYPRGNFNIKDNELLGFKWYDPNHKPLFYNINDSSQSQKSWVPENIVNQWCELGIICGTILKNNSYKLLQKVIDTLFSANSSSNLTVKKKFSISITTKDFETLQLQFNSANLTSPIIHEKFIFEKIISNGDSFGLSINEFLDTMSGNIIESIMPFDCYEIKRGLSRDLYDIKKCELEQEKEKLTRQIQIINIDVDRLQDCVQELKDKKESLVKESIETDRKQLLDMKDIPLKYESKVHHIIKNYTSKEFNIISYLSKNNIYGTSEGFYYKSLYYALLKRDRDGLDRLNMELEESQKKIYRNISDKFNDIKFVVYMFNRVFLYNATDTEYYEILRNIGFLSVDCICDLLTKFFNTIKEKMDLLNSLSPYETDLDIYYSDGIIFDTLIKFDTRVNTLVKNTIYDNKLNESINEHYNVYVDRLIEKYSYLLVKLFEELINISPYTNYDTLEFLYKRIKLFLNNTIDTSNVFKSMHEKYSTIRAKIFDIFSQNIKKSKKIFFYKDGKLYIPYFDKVIVTFFTSIHADAKYSLAKFIYDGKKMMFELYIMIYNELSEFNKTNIEKSIAMCVISTLEKADREINVEEYYGKLKEKVKDYIEKKSFEFDSVEYSEIQTIINEFELQQAEEARRQAEAEEAAKRRADAEAERRRKAEEARIKAEAEAEEARIKAEAEEEARIKAEAEEAAKRRADAEAERRRKAEEARIKAEADEARIKAEAEEARIKAEAEEAIEIQKKDRKLANIEEKLKLEREQIEKFKEKKEKEIDKQRQERQIIRKEQTILAIQNAEQARLKREQKNQALLEETRRVQEQAKLQRQKDMETKRIAEQLRIEKRKELENALAEKKKLVALEKQEKEEKAKIEREAAEKKRQERDRFLKSKLEQAKEAKEAKKAKEEEEEAKRKAKEENIKREIQAEIRRKQLDEEIRTKLYDGLLDKSKNLVSEYERLSQGFDTSASDLRKLIK